MYVFMDSYWLGSYKQIFLVTVENPSDPMLQSANHYRVINENH